MFESEWDLFDSGASTATSDMTITVSNVPYATYDVCFYVQDANDANTRGGKVTANGTTKSITMFNSRPTSLPKILATRRPIMRFPGMTQQSRPVRISALRT